MKTWLQFIFLLLALSASTMTARPTGYGAVPGYRPVALGHGADVVQSSAWRGRWVDITGYYNIGERLYDPVTGMWLSYDPTWNESDPNYLSFAGGDPIMGFDPDGRFTSGMYQGGVGMVEGGGTLLWDVGGALGYGIVSDFNEPLAADIYGNQMQSLVNMGNGISTMASQAAQGDFSDIDSELTGGPNQSAAYRAGYVTTAAATFLFGGEVADAGEAGQAADVSASATAAADVGSEATEEATVAADQSGQMIEEPAEVPVPSEEVPIANAALQEAARATVAIPASAAAAVSDIAEASSAVTDPAQMLQAPAELPLLQAPAQPAALLPENAASLSAETTAADSPMTTVLGSGRDVAPYVGQPGFNTFTGAGIPTAELDTQNALWLNNAIQRGDQIWLVTDPAAHQALMNQLNLQSAYLNLELPMLGEYSGVSAIPKFAPPPTVGVP